MFLVWKTMHAWFLLCCLIVFLQFFNSATASPKPGMKKEEGTNFILENLNVNFFLLDLTSLPTAIQLFQLNQLPTLAWQRCIKRPFIGPSKEFCKIHWLMRISCIEPWRDLFATIIVYDETMTRPMKRVRSFSSTKRSCMDPWKRVCVDLIYVHDHVIWVYIPPPRRLFGSFHKV